MKRYISVFIVVPMLMLMASCEHLNEVFKSDSVTKVTLELTVKAAVSRIIMERTDWAPDIQDVSRTLVAAIDADEGVTLEQLEALVKAKVDYTGITIEEQILVDTLVSNVRLSIETYVNTTYPGSTANEYVMNARTVFVWVDEVATRYMQ
jgi:hypothetical protein